MRILDISFKNLNSLCGEWHINLSDSIYTSNGIFAITGPTGAGKTTIFDAICLALYGQTPRLGKVGTKDNEIMSRRTNECYSRVIFETHGNKYICTWKQYKAGRNRQLQQATHTLAKYSGEILTSKVTDTRAKVEEITGMDFERFTQAVMLEQGRFDAFISADRKDRAEILELITGTEIYSRISMMVFDRCKDEKIRLSGQKLILDDKKSRLHARSPEAVSAELKREISRRTSIEAEYNAVKAAKEWHTELMRLQSELDKINDAVLTQQKILDAFEPKRINLDAAERASSLAADYSTLTQMRRDRTKFSAACDRLAGEISRSKAELSRIVNENIPKAEAELARIKGGITESPETLQNQIISAVTNYEQIMQALMELTKTRIQYEELYAKAKTEAQNAASIKDNALKRKDSTARENSTALDEFMHSQAATAEAVLDEEREKLMPGLPCPLCGSTEHPYISEDKHSDSSSQELFSRTEKLREKLQHCKEAYESACTEWNAAEAQYNSALLAENSAKSDYERTEEDLRAKQEERERLHDTVSEAISPLNLTGLKSTSDIKTQVKQWLERIKQIENYITAQTNEKQKYEGTIEANSRSLVLEQEQLSHITAELHSLEEAFSEKLRSRNFADENEFSAAYLDGAQLDSLRRESREITERMSVLTARRTETAQSLSDKAALKVTELAREETDIEFERHETELKDVNGRIAVLEQTLKDTEALSAEIAESEQAMKKQQDIFENWSALNVLIGSADGDKFRIIAQKVTLGLVVNNANMYLQKMSGRYILKLRPDSGNLDLSVIDNNQAGEVRPTENLSGGERFIVSLALALGLSQISGSRAQVDSLFLDEGFGSLDEETLNTALEAFGEVKREGRMIGIISHVAALRERIAAQINVIPKRDGVSIIEGPGCSREG